MSAIERILQRVFLHGLQRTSDAMIEQADNELKQLETYKIERDRLYVAYHRLWTKHGDLAEPTVDEVIYPGGKS